MEMQNHSIPNLQNIPIISGQPIQNENQNILPKVNADIETKKHICIHWCVFFLLVSIFILTSAFMPDSTMFVQKQDPCVPDKEGNFDQRSWVEQNKQQFCNQSTTNYVVFRKLDKKNQFLIVYGKFSFYSPMGFEMLYINYTATLFGLTKESGNFTDNFIVHKKHSMQTNCENYFDELYGENGEEDESEESDESDEYYYDDVRTGDRLLQREDIPNYSSLENDYSDEYYNPQICDETVLVYIPILDYHDYLLVINYTNSYPYFQENSHLLLEGITVDPRYSNSVLIVRYTFFAFSLITFSLFGLRMRKLAFSNWVIEQKFVSVLSFLLLWFNDPLFAATLIVPNRITAVIGVIFFSNFICCLFLYWLVIYHRIVLENGTKNSTALTKSKIIVCLLLWIFFVVSYSILVIQYFKDPTTTFDDFHHKAYMAFKVLQFLFSFAIFLYLLKYLIQFCRCYETRIWRYKLIGLFNIFYMMCLGLFIFSGSFDIYNLTGTEVLICISILNLYIYYQQYLWSPSKQGLIQYSNLEQNINIDNRAYDELEFNDRNINQENVVDEKFKVEEDKVILNE